MGVGVSLPEQGVWMSAWAQEMLGEDGAKTHFIIVRINEYHTIVSHF